MRLGSATLLLVLTIALATPLADAQDTTAPLLVPDQGTEVPPVTEPVAALTAFEAEHYVFTSATRTSTITVPEVPWNRVMLYYHSWPDHPGGDPWDRTVMVGIENTEVVHGTTTRGDFDLVEDVTEYASLLEPGSQVEIASQLDSWVGNGIFVTVELRFYDDPTAPLGDQPYDAVVSPLRWVGIWGTGQASAPASFPAEPPNAAVVELFTSGHTACGEFWYTCPENSATTPTFHIYVDETLVGTVEALPYVYALAGFDGSETAWLLNQHVWWSAHLLLDRAGVHHGVGEIPAYRAHLPGELLPLLTGERTVTVDKVDHDGFWPTSVSFLLEA